MLKCVNSGATEMRPVLSYLIVFTILVFICYGDYLGLFPELAGKIMVAIAAVAMIITICASWLMK